MKRKAIKRCGIYVPDYKPDHPDADKHGFVHIYIGATREEAQMADVGKIMKEFYAMGRLQ
jgi:flagellar basal body rod protein FlgC